MRCNLEEESPGLDMTPMIDCVFLLLIFFLVASTMKKIDRELPLTLPPAETAIEVQQPDDYHIIGITSEGGLYLDGVPVGLGQMQRDVRNLGAKNPDVKIRLDVDRDAHFNEAMMVMDMLRFENLKNVAINTKKREERGY